MIEKSHSRQLSERLCEIAEETESSSAMQGFYRRFGKRYVDLVVSAVALVILLPLIGLVALLIRRRLGSPVFFRQQRGGYCGMPFHVLKFRTMTDDVDEHGQLLPDEHRLSRLGRFLRQTSLDELPQLFNVVSGTMSLIGPRPLLVEYLERYSPEQARRHEVRPGITGWAQVNGRNALTWEERFRLDVWYVNNLNWLVDIRIVLSTIAKVFRQGDVNAEGHATMPKFMGSNSDT